MSIYENRVVRLDFGEPSFPCPSEAKAEAIKYIANPDCYYAPTKGDRLLLGKVSKYLLNEKQMNISKEFITITSGGLMGLNAIIKCLKDHGVTKVYYPNPGFPPYQFIEANIGIHMEPYPMISEKGGVEVLSEIAENIPEKTFAFILTSPNNPNGITFSNESWKKLNESLINQYIICDNSFESFIFQEDRNFLPTGGNIFHSFSFSKSFSLADYRIGYVISPSLHWSEVISRYHWFMQLSTSVISQKAATGALNCKEEYLSENKKVVRKNLYSAINKLKQYEIEVSPPDGGFFLWINIKKTRQSSDEFVQYALKDYKLSIISGVNFGTNGEDYVRLNCATDSLALEEGINRFIKCYIERVNTYEYPI